MKKVLVAVNKGKREGGGGLVSTVRLMEDVGFIRCPLNTSLHRRESGFWNPEKLCLWNRESGKFVFC